MKTNKLIFAVIGAIFLVLTGFLVHSDARVDVSVGINLPVYTFPAPPPLVVIPGTYAYAVPDVDVDILFYRGYWYRPYEGRWYRSRAYNGPWRYIAPRYVPGVLIELPPDYRYAPPEYRRIPYGDLHRNWRTWERDRYWERDERWREGRHDGRGERRGDKHEGYRHEGDRHEGYRHEGDRRD